jgi:membrane protease YdiL (CAAX protease family)
VRPTHVIAAELSRTFSQEILAPPDRSLGTSWRALGLTLHGWPLQLVVGLSGLVSGAPEYQILRPDPLATRLSWQAIWQPALILLVCTGLLEEMIFRGLLQRSAGDVLGRWGIPYVALLFAVLHLGYESLVDVAFVLAVGLFLAWVVHRTRSLLGVTLAHGLTNVMLFLIMPFLGG